jgi:molybdate-binding protein/DNA-binding XRE family transcriptional regulator
MASAGNDRDDGASRLESHVRELRRAAGLTQEELARRCHVSRQALIAIESGRVAPSVAVALRLAAALGRRVEELFRLVEERGSIDAELAAPAPAGGARAPRTRVVLAHVDERWVAHPLRQDDPMGFGRAADGVLRPRARGSRQRVELLRPLGELEANLLVVGCDPALGLLAARLSGSGAPVTWMHASSQAALEMLARAHAHVAGAHLFDEGSGEFNVPFVRRMPASRPMLVVTLASWELGLLVRPGLQASVRGIEAVLQPGLRFVHREPGAEARALVERLLRRADAPVDALARAPVAHGHFAVAQAIATGGADIGVATRAAALAHDLAFVPLTEERFDLVMPRELTSTPRVAQLIETLQGRAFRRELACLGGYQTRRSGDAIPV